MEDRKNNEVKSKVVLLRPLLPGNPPRKGPSSPAMAAIPFKYDKVVAIYRREFNCYDSQGLMAA